MVKFPDIGSCYPINGDQIWQSGKSLKRILNGFDPISLSEMDHVALLNRTDTKFLMSERQLLSVLSGVDDDYRVLEVNRQRLNAYETLYFDTPDFTFYHQHHDGYLNRYKVRSREYVDSHLSFLEVKYKTNHQRTIKTRLRTGNFITSLDQDSSNFVARNAACDPRQLEAKLWNQFNRITLVSRHSKERLTIDLNLCFDDGCQLKNLDGLVIAEVKQERLDLNSVFIQGVRKQGVHPSGFSKYCIGIALLNQRIKQNNFKPNLRKLDRLVNGGIANV
jgi:hypothetical protein